MPKMDFLNHQEAEKINKQKWKQFWWTPCIVAYFQNLRLKYHLLRLQSPVWGGWVWG